MRETFLLRLSDTLQPLEDALEIQTAALRILGPHLSSHCAYYVEVDHQRDEYVIAHAWSDAGVTGHATRCPLHAWPMPCLADGRRRVIEDVDTHQGIPDDLRASYRRHDIRACVVAPLMNAGRLAAALVISSRTPRAWADDDVELIVETAQRSWHAVERARAEAAVRASDERLRALLSNVKDFAVFTIDPDGRITTWSDGARRLKGYTAEEILGQPLSRFYPVEDAERPAREMQTALTTGNSENESWRVRKDGSRIWVNEIMTPLHAPDGRHLGFTTVSRDLTERKTYEDALLRAHDKLEQRVQERTADLARANAMLLDEVAERRAAEAQIKQLFERLVSIQEEERRRIAREIHDNLGQQLTALRMNLEVARTGLDDDPEKLAQAQRTASLAEELDRTIDFLTWELRPAALDHLGLPAALQHHLAGWSDRFGIAADFDVLSDGDVRLPVDVEANLYRIVQEALHNVVKHAEATHVTVFMEYRHDETLVVVEDDGRGFDGTTVSDTGHLGLISMRERAALAGGRLDVESTPGSGTTVIIRIANTQETSERVPS